jgi:Tol biopolymer transport system component
MSKNFIKNNNLKPRFLILFIAGILALTFSGCATESNEGQNINQPPTEIPKGILVSSVPDNADIIFESVRHVLNNAACLDANYNVDQNFINLPDCNSLIYDSGELASPRQLFVMDYETGNVTQITNTDYYFVSGQVVDLGTIMTIAIGSDTDGNGKINEKDKAELYLLNLAAKTMECLTNGLGLTSINNPDYSHINNKIVFSARRTTESHNYIFTVDAGKNLTQITNDSNYMDFDCSWSDDGTKIVFNRVPQPFLAVPSQIWLMDADGTNLEKITDGGPDPGGEGSHASYPIGTDADPDLSPDSSKIVFSRLKTGLANAGFGVWELVVIDVATKQEEVLDSQYANMIPEWKSGGILFTRQIGASSAMDIKQSLYIYNNNTFEELEDDPYNVFPIGAFGGHWVE